MPSKWAVSRHAQGGGGLVDDHGCVATLVVCESVPGDPYHPQGAQQVRGLGALRAVEMVVLTAVQHMIERHPEALAFEHRLDVVDFNEKGLRSFVKFCTRFCFNAGQLTSGVYKSSDGKYTIEYLPTIVYPNGRESSTPARIGVESGIIQVSQAKFRPMTVPMRMAILLHEYSHFYVNDRMHDETEADLNGLLIYLGLGYPRIEAHQSFLNTFVNVPSQQNKQRYDKIKKFIDDFEKNNYIVYE